VHRAKGHIYPDQNVRYDKDSILSAITRWLRIWQAGDAYRGVKWQQQPLPLKGQEDGDKPFRPSGDRAFCVVHCLS
jgi:hypothetical protein